MNVATIVLGIFAICLLVLFIVFRKQIKSLMSGESETLPQPSIKHIINCATDPFVPNGYVLDKHQPGSKDYEFDAVKVFLFQSEKQEKGILVGEELLQELVDIPSLNANVLDYLMVHPELIPESWKNKRIYFLGTIYLLNDIRVVRYLYWSKSQWTWCQRWLESGFDHRHFAAVVPKN